LPADIPILPPDASRAARNLHVNAHCSINEPWKGIAELTWVPAMDRGLEQRVVMTVYRDGFEKGVFDASEMLSVDQSDLEWERLSPGIIHFWRVLTRYEDGWVPSDDSSFEAPVCAVDFAPTPGP
jgi:hypothetical protein